MQTAPIVANCSHVWRARCRQDTTTSLLLNSLFFVYFVSSALVATCTRVLNCCSGHRATERTPNTTRNLVSPLKNRIAHARLSTTSGCSARSERLVILTSSLGIVARSQPHDAICSLRFSHLHHARNNRKDKVDRRGRRGSNLQVKMCRPSSKQIDMRRAKIVPQTLSIFERFLRQFERSTAYVEERRRDDNLYMFSSASRRTIVKHFHCSRFAFYHEDVFTAASIGCMPQQFYAKTLITKMYHF